MAQGQRGGRVLGTCGRLFERRKTFIKTIETGRSNAIPEGDPLFVMSLRGN